MYITIQEISMGSKRTIITLSEEDKLWLEGYSKAFDISVAEVIRRGIKGLREGSESEAYHKLVENTQGIWKEGDGLSYQMDIRSEWESQ
jgi:hypothetical protein